MARNNNSNKAAPAVPKPEEAPVSKSGHILKIKIGKGKGKQAGDKLTVLEYEKMKSVGFDVDALFE